MHGRQTYKTGSAFRKRRALLEMWIRYVPKYPSYEERAVRFGGLRLGDEGGFREEVALMLDLKGQLRLEYNHRFSDYIHIGLCGPMT